MMLKTAASLLAAAAIGAASTVGVSATTGDASPVTPGISNGAPLSDVLASYTDTPVVFGLTKTNVSKTIKAYSRCNLWVENTRGTDLATDPNKWISLLCVPGKK